METSASAPAESGESDQSKDAHSASEEEDLRRSDRARNPTVKMLAWQAEEASRKDKKLVHLYEKGKIQARTAREQLKSNISESEISALIDALERTKDSVT